MSRSTAETFTLIKTDLQVVKLLPADGQWKSPDDQRPHGIQDFPEIERMNNVLLNTLVSDDDSQEK